MVVKSEAQIAQEIDQKIRDDRAVKTFVATALFTVYPLASGAGTYGFIGAIIICTLFAMIAHSHQGDKILKE